MAEKDTTKTKPITSFSQLSCGKLKGEDKKQCEKDRKAFAKKMAKEFASSVVGGASKEGLQEALQHLTSKKK